MKMVLLIYVLVGLFSLDVQAQEHSEPFELKLKSKIPLGNQGWLYLPKKRQALIFHKDSSELRDIETGELLKTFAPVNTKYYIREPSPNEEKFIAYDLFKKEAELWDITNGRLIAPISGQKSDISKVVWSADSCFFLLYSYGNFKELFVWNAETGRTQFVITSEYGSHAQFSPDGKLLLSTLDNVLYRQHYSVRLWDVESGKLQKEFSTAKKNRHIKARFTPDGKDILAEQEGRLFSWDINTGEIKNVFSESIDKIYTLTNFSPDGKLLLVHKTKFRGLTKEDETWFEIYDVETGELKVELKTRKPGKHQVEIHQIVWRPDSKALISAGERYQKEYGAESWDASTGGQKFILSPLVARHYINPMESGHKKLDEISYTPDSKFLITSNSDFFRIWDAETGKLLKRFEANDGRFWRYFFTPDRKYLGKMDMKEMTISFYELKIT